jgi:DNA-binding response OmpR family regulator
MRVLLIEDDECIAKSLETVLAKENYAVDVAVDGELGWQFIESFTYDLILLDVVLPKRDGISLCRQIRAYDHHTPVLLLTACNSSSERIIGLDAGADDYVVKPFELQELLARMRVLLRRSSSPVVPLLEWNQLRLDPTSFQVTYSERLLHLTPKEYRLLELFLRNPRHVLTRNVILEHLWGLEGTPGEDTITAHIKGLRQKLKQAGAPANFIETVYGMGYRLRDSSQAAQNGSPDGSQDSSPEPISPLNESTSSDLLALLPDTAPATVTASLKLPSDDDRQQIQTALQEIWSKYAPKNYEYIQTLKQALTKLQHQVLLDQLGADQGEPDQTSIDWEQSYIATHKLAGALGLFGRPQGSELALKLEPFFKKKQLPTSIELAEISAQIEQLSTIVSYPPASSPDGSALNTGFGTVVDTVLNTVPVSLSALILIDNDPIWAAQLRQLIAVTLDDKQNHIEAVVEITSGQQLELYLESYLESYISDDRDVYETLEGDILEPAQFAQPHFNITVLNLQFTDLSDPHLDLIKTITHQIPPVPLLACTNQISLDLRVKLAQAGVYALLPQVADQVLDLVARLHPATPSRILMVDHDAQTLDRLQSILEPWKLQLHRLELDQPNSDQVSSDQVKPDRAQQPPHFWETLQACDPSLLILAAEMPTYSGIDLCHTLRNTLTWHRLPVLLLTDHLEAAILQAALNAGANALLAKSAPQTEIAYRVLVELQCSWLL